METVQYNLPQDRIPRAWYNIAADLPEPMAPPLHPGTLKPIGPDDLAPLFPMSLILQEVSTEREIEIPEEVRQVYAQWRPSPLFRARRLEKALDTPAQIYYKYEGVSPAGSHKPNTAVAQAVLQQEGRHETPFDGDGRGAVGLGSGHGVRVLRPGVQGLHGARELRPEALSPRADGSIRRVRYRQPKQRDGVGPRDSGGASGLRMARWASPSPRPWKWPPRTRTPSTRWAAC